MAALILAALAAVVYWGLCTALGRRFPGCTASLAGREIFLSNDD